MNQSAAVIAVLEVQPFDTTDLQTINQQFDWRFKNNRELVFHLEQRGTALLRDKTLGWVELKDGKQLSKEESELLNHDFSSWDFKSDAELSPEQLDCKYNPNGDDEHPEYTRSDWRWAVAEEQNTDFGYWEWVSHQLKK